MTPPRTEEELRVDSEIDNLAAGLLEPSRQRDVHRYHRALLDAMNRTHTDGEQDAFAVLEAMAMLLAQQIGNLPYQERVGAAQFVIYRALQHATKLPAAEIREDALPEKHDA